MSLQVCVTLFSIKKYYYYNKSTHDCGHIHIYTSQFKSTLFILDSNKGINDNYYIRGCMAISVNNTVIVYSP